MANLSAVVSVRSVLGLTSHQPTSVTYLQWLPLLSLRLRPFDSRRRAC